ncbi:MAG: efflux RND transporter periplasmic adaptor subunit, partial [Alphaproteobacteria bacterium]
MARTALALIALLSVSSATGCHHEEHRAEERGKLLVTTPLRKDVDLVREYVAQVRARQHIELRSQERGYLQEIFVDEGQSITAGQRMFRLMPVLYDAEVREAQAEAAKAKIEYDNTSSLAEKKIVSPQELALAKATLAKAEAKLSLAATHKGLSEIHAPFSGIMGRFQARLGSLIEEGDLLTTLSDNSRLWAYFNVSEREYLRLKEQYPELRNVEVQLRMADGSIFPQKGVIETIEADFDNETGTIALRAGFPNPDGLLRHGETGQILITRPLKDALLVPQKATFDVLDKKFVFVVDDENVAHSRAIKVAAEVPQLYAVESGLTEKDRVLVDGLRKVRDGQEIDPDVQPPAEVFGKL